MARKELGPATLQIVQAVRSNTPDRPLLAAVSGGADSLALAFAVARICRERGQPGAGITVDHGLQSGSAGQAERVLGQLRRLGFTDTELITVDPAAGAGPEADARSARYRALDEAASTRQAEIVLGHTLDDQAETVLLGLARGSGARSLSGMSSRPGRLRPLLGLRRSTTRACCAELGLDVWDDPHNDDARFTRSRVRQQVLPVLESELGPGIAESLARTADLLRDDADLLDRLSEQLLGRARRDDALDCAVLADAEPALLGRALKSWLDDHGAEQTPYAQVQAVTSLINNWRGQRELHLPGLSVRRVDGRLIAERH